MKGEADTTRYGPLRREVLQLLELVAVLGLAFAQPIFDLLGKNPLLFVAWNATPARTLGAVAVVVLGPALVAYLVEVLAALAGPATRRVVHVVLVGTGIGLVVMEATKQLTELGAVPLVVVGVVAGVLGGLARARYRGFRTWLRVLAIAPVAFAVLLLVGPGVGGGVRIRPGRGGGDRRPPAPRGDDRHGRVPAHVPARRTRCGRRRAVPEPRRAVAPGHLVPQRHDGCAVHRGRGPGGPHRPAAAEPDDGARGGRVPAQPVPAARRDLRPQRARVGDAAVPDLGVRAEATPDRGGHRVPRDALRHRHDLVGLRRPRLPRRGLLRRARRRGHHRVDDRRGIPLHAWARPRDPSSTSCTCCSRTSRGTTSRRARTTPRCPVTPTDCTARSGRTTTSPRSCACGTSSRCRRPTRSSGRWSPG